MNKIELSTIFDLIKNDDHYGFELLYQYHSRLMYSAAFSVLKNEQDAKEVIQNVMVKLFKLKKEQFPTKGHSSWFYTLIKNEALMVLRKESKKYSVVEMPEIPVLNQEIIQFMDMQQYYSLIQGLNEKQKEVVTLKVLGDLSHKEIAEILNKPIGTIQWIYSTSIKQLKIALSSMVTSVLLLIGALSVVLNKQPETMNDNFEMHLFRAEPIVVNKQAQQFEPFVSLLVLLILLLIVGIVLVFIKPDKFLQNKNLKSSNK